MSSKNGKPPRRQSRRHSRSLQPKGLLTEPPRFGRSPRMSKSEILTSIRRHKKRLPQKPRLLQQPLISLKQRPFPSANVFSAETKANHFLSPSFESSMNNPWLVDPKRSYSVIRSEAFFSSSACSSMNQPRNLFVR